MHEYAHGVPKDDAAAAALYQRACDAGWLGGCYNLAIMFENGRGVAQDRGRALALYEAACDAGATPACEKAKPLRQRGGTQGDGETGSPEKGVPESGP
jgi:TPR repeat protein